MTEKRQGYSVPETTGGGNIEPLVEWARNLLQSLHEIMDAENVESVPRSCQHNFVWLRQDVIWQGDLHVAQQDVFFCTKCTEIRRV